MKNSPLSKPYFRLFWPAKLIKTLFDYFNHKIKPKPSLDGTLSPNTISISEGLYCTVLSRRRRRRQGRQCHRFRQERTRCATVWCCRRSCFPTTTRLSWHPSWIRTKFCSTMPSVQFRQERTRCATSWCCRRSCFRTTTRLSRHPRWIRIIFFSIVETKFQQLWNKQGCQCRQIRQGFRQKRIRCATVYRLSGFPTNHPPL